MVTPRCSAALLAMCWLVAASATAAEPEGWAYDLSNELMSPFCPGRTLSECPSPQADSLRMWLLVQESAGRGRDDVEAELLERYGDVILAAPRMEGVGIAAYAIPAVVFALGGAVVALFLRRQTRRAERTPAEASGAPLDPEFARIVDEELNR